VAINDDGHRCRVVRPKLSCVVREEECVMSDFNLTYVQTGDLGNKIGGQEGAKGILSGELIVVRRNDPRAAISSSDNGGISPYVTVPLLNVEAFIADWREFYRLYGMKANPPSLKRFPPVTPGFNWGVWVLKGLTPQRAYEMIQSMFPCWKWCGVSSLDEVVDFDKEVRDVRQQQRIVWCEDSVEPPARLANLSAFQIAERQMNTLGLTETLLLHGWFYCKSGGKSGGKHLDVKNVSLCPASRYSDGNVPSVNWNGNYSKLNVNRYNPGNANDDLRSRQKFRQ